MKEKFELLEEQFNALKTDWDRLQFLKDHPKDLKAVLDNDITMVELIQPDEINDDDWEYIVTDIKLNDFDDYHYWSDGCLLLFKFAGITAESC
jgi:hypothetical protein